MRDPTMDTPLDEGAAPGDEAGRLNGAKKVNSLQSGFGSVPDVTAPAASIVLPVVVPPSPVAKLASFA